MDILGILLILVIVLVFYKLYYSNIKKGETFSPTGLQNLQGYDGDANTNMKIKKKHRKCANDLFEDDCVDRMFGSKSAKLAKPIEININPYFQEMQFHQDYRDTMNAFNLMCPQKKAFNKADLPLLNAEKPTDAEVKPFVQKFVKELNKTVKNNVYDLAAQKLNSWDDNMPNVGNTEISKNTSWDKFQKELGLPTSIYPEPAKRAGVKLLKVDRVEKAETDTEVRYSIYLILQKKNVDDQMLVKVSFVTDKKDVNLDREFFDKDKNEYSTSVIIEEISILGFMITQGFGKGGSDKQSATARETLYEFDGFTDGRMISEKEVVKQLNEKRRQIEQNYLKAV